jgi:hypothetical protein
VAKIHFGATLTPPFREFLPPWVARQPWYAGVGSPSLSAVGYFRLEDPAGEVGIETHLVTDGAALYQIPMTYRGTPLVSTAPDALIATAEHSVLGTRWIYDGPADPLWHSQMLDLIRSNGVSDPSGRPDAGPTEAHGRQLIPGDLADDMVRLDVIRVVSPGNTADDPGIAGLVTGVWHPDGPGAATATGCLAVARMEPAAWSALSRLDRIRE